MGNGMNPHVLQYAHCMISTCSVSHFISISYFIPGYILRVIIVRRPRRDSGRAGSKVIRVYTYCAEKARGAWERG